MKSVLAVFLSALLVTFSLPVHVDALSSEAQTILIGLDLSASTPLIRDDGYAARAGARVAKELVALPFKSRVMLRTFGNYDPSDNGLKIDQVISSQAKPQAVAEAVGTLIANVPKLVRNGKLPRQGRTNIVPFLETMSQVIDCSASDVRVILVTDGIEDSEYAILTRHHGKLPKPVSTLYPHCDQLLILGLGVSFHSPSATARLRAQWQGWAQAAGFQHFSGLYDW